LDPRTHRRALAIIGTEIEHRVAIPEVAISTRRISAKNVQRYAHALPERVEERLVGEVRVIAVDRVLELELPVPVVAVLVRSRAGDDFTVGREIAEVVELLLDRGSEVLVERDAARREAREHEPPVGRDARRRRERPVLAPKIALFVRS